MGLPAVVPLLSWVAVSAGKAGEVAENSVEPPYFDGDGFSIPNWDFFGNAVVSDESVRLTPDRQNKRGALWNLKPCNLKSWQLDVEFSVTGQGKSLFGDGFAIWYTEEVGQLGAALGNTEVFTGLGIFADTYDNHAEDHGHPWIAALYNDGTHEYDHDEDGKSIKTEGCQSFFRNLDYNTHLRLVYQSKLHTVTAWTSIQGNGEYEECFVARGIFLPTGYHFGASASTGDLADNHDIVSMKVRPAPAVTPEEQAAFDEYKKNNPDEGKTTGLAKNIAKKHQKKQVDKMISNHKKQREKRKAKREERRGRDDEESSPVMLVLMLIGALGVIGAIVYFVMTASSTGGGGGADHRKFSF